MAAITAKAEAGISQGEEAVRGSPIIKLSVKASTHAAAYLMPQSRPPVAR